LTFEISVEDLASMDVLKGKTQLDKPIHDLSLRKVFPFCFLFLHMVSQITHYRQVDKEWLEEKRLQVDADSTVQRMCLLSQNSITMINTPLSMKLHR